jgi:hypothetical protein
MFILTGVLFVITKKKDVQNTENQPDLKICSLKAGGRYN